MIISTNSLYLWNDVQVLWPDCGWQPVSLTDLITSVSVKKVYYKATLCVHPDKVQQKGANIEQKYTAEKIFDRLKVFNEVDGKIIHCSYFIMWHFFRF